MRITRLLIFAVAGLLLMPAPNVALGGIMNGDFATGDFTDWTRSAIDDSLNPISPDPFIFIDTLGSNNVAHLVTGEFSDGLFTATLEQTFTLNADKPILSFDFEFTGASLDPTGTGTSVFFDSYLVSIDNGIDFFELLLVDQFGPLVDPFGTAPGSAALGVPDDPVFDYNFTADLSSLVGQSLTLLIEVNQEDDGFQFASNVFGQIGNRAALTEKFVPEPASFAVWSLLLGMVSSGCRSTDRREGQRVKLDPGIE